MNLEPKDEERHHSNRQINPKSDTEFLLFNELYKRLKQKYNVSEILQSIEAEEMLIPVSIFNEKLSSLEAISKYFIENKNLKLGKVSKILNRSSANIWDSYSRSLSKHKKPLVEFGSLYLPSFVISDINFSVLENIVAHLKETHQKSYHEIAVLLKRNDRTIWATYHKFLKKRKKIAKE